ncbi:MAG: hypothetical protein HQK84_01215 [Nitrospinae bacterium]|nr:hypothetical protein [Nitrospinota bacterium]
MAISNDEDASFSKIPERHKKRNKRYKLKNSSFKNRITGKEEMLDKWDSFNDEDFFQKSLRPSNKAFKYKKRYQSESYSQDDEETKHLS